MMKKLVLIADSDYHRRVSLGKRLIRWGYGVVEACDGLDAIRCASIMKLDAIILDHSMPAGDARAVARVLRREFDTPIIFLAQGSRKGFRSVVVELADTYCLGKPLDPAKLRALLDSLLNVSPRPEIALPRPLHRPAAIPARGVLQPRA